MFSNNKNGKNTKYTHARAQTQYAAGKFVVRMGELHATFGDPK